MVVVGVVVIVMVGLMRLVVWAFGEGGGRLVMPAIILCSTSRFEFERSFIFHGGVDESVVTFRSHLINHYYER